MPAEPDPEPEAAAAPRTSGRHLAVRGAALAALGVVFGDIGTSPIYTISTVFNPADPHPVAVTEEAVLGVASLIFWSVMIVVTLKYVFLVMRADNHGEGGILALITRLQGGPERAPTRAVTVLTALGIFGAALFLGDSMITPAISVLSAVEGMKVVAPGLGEAVVPITAVIIIGLFLVQRFGSARVGGLFGPVMVGWFTVIGVLGVYGIAKNPQVLRALWPGYAVGFLVGHFGVAFFALAAIVLAITGAEALYADMGHFGRGPITRAWLTLVLPACTLSYFGQAGLILQDPNTNVSAPFFLLCPDWARIPLVVIATAATVIASQAVITGAFSLAHQAVQLGYLPRLRVEHTSAETFGQIYVPWINWLLAVAVLALVFAFRSSAALAFAFGMAVTATITITTLLFFYIARRDWGTSLWLVLPGAAFFLGVEGLFLAANLTKLLHGAWLPLLIGVVAFTILITWRRGRELVTRARQADEGPLQGFVDQLHDAAARPVRVPGTAVFLNRGKQTAPLALRANVLHNHVLHEHVVILSVETVPVPYLADAERIVLDDLRHTDDPITHVTVRYGYLDDPDIPRALRLAAAAGLDVPTAPADVSWFLSTIDLHVGAGPGLSAWRKRLFLATSRITADAADYFHLPRDRTVIVGSRIDI